jgi:predicted permease
MMLIVVALVLLIACATIANLLLARGAARGHEQSVRRALGASRWQIARMALIESAVLACTGAALGLVFANWASRLLVAQLSTSTEPVSLDTALDWRVLAFTAATMAGTALLAGVVPALRATRAAPMDALREHGRIAGDGALGGRWSSALIVAQVALSLTLVVAAGLLVQTFERLARAPLGLDRDRTMFVTITAPTVPAADRNLFYHRLVAAARTVPGVEAAGGSLNPPIVGTLVGDIVVTAPGVAPPPNAEAVSQYTDITPGALAAYGTALRAGRDVDDRDTDAAPKVILINETLGRRLFPGRNMLGATVALTFRSSLFGDVPVGTRTIVGITADAAYRSIRAPMQPTIYSPMAQRGGDPILFTYFYLAVRSAAGSPTRLTRSITAALTALNPDLTMTFRPLATAVDDSLAQDRLVAILAGFFGALALLLAGPGLYGVTSYAVNRRRTEIGIRMALGAGPRRVVRLVLVRVSMLVGAGILIGGAISIWAAALVAPLLYGLEARDPATLVLAAVVLAAIGALAGWVPAYGASRIDPAEVLRET